MEEVILGNVVSGGIGQAPARQAAVYAGLPHSVCCTTVGTIRPPRDKVFAGRHKGAASLPGFAGQHKSRCPPLAPSRPRPTFVPNLCPSPHADQQGVRVGHEERHVRSPGHPGPTGHRRGRRLRVHVQHPVLLTQRPRGCAVRGEHIPPTLTHNKPLTHTNTTTPPPPPPPPPSAPPPHYHHHKLTAGNLVSAACSPNPPPNTSPMESLPTPAYPTLSPPHFHFDFALTFLATLKKCALLHVLLRFLRS